MHGKSRKERKKGAQRMRKERVREERRTEDSKRELTIE